jgi:endonuclease/exonuclease/phosphatase family metal-dependent hydrolase
VRVATFNVLSGRTPGEDHVDAGRFAAAVASLDADVLALQEVDRGQPRSGYVDLADVAAEAGGAVAHRFAAAMTGLPDGSWTPTTNAGPADGPAYGIALLSRHPVTDWRVVRLPPLPVRVPYRWHGARRLSWVRDEQRVALLATVESPLGPLRVAATHVSYLRLSGTRQVRHLLRASGRLDLLLGDLNLPPAAVTRLTGMRPLVAAETFPVDRPRTQIDHVLAGTGRLVPTGGGAVALPVSDHRALVVDVVNR